VIKQELKVALNTIEGSTNPEIYHFHRGSHPGIKYYIKTIMPGPYILNDNTAPIWRFWTELSNVHPRLIKLVDIAYDWEGNVIAGWWTIWIENRIDIRWVYEENTVVDYHLVEYDVGLKLSAEDAIETLDYISNRHTADDHACYEKLKEISVFLRTYTSDNIADRNRKKFTVVTDDNIHDEAID